MKRIYQIVTVVVALIIPVAIGTPALAATVCDVGYTGPNSQNMCTSVEVYQCTVTNTNTVTITNSNTQEAISGVVAVSGNGTGGGAASGSVTNDATGTTFAVSITNSDPISQTPGVCTATAVVPATEVPETPTPATPVQPVRTASPEALPVTSGSAALSAGVTIVAIGASTISVGLLMRRLQG